MMEYTSKYWNMLTPLIKKSLLKRYGKEETAELLRKTNQIYRDLLRRADDISMKASFFLRSGMRRTDRSLWMNCVQSQRR